MKVAALLVLAAVAAAMGGCSGPASVEDCSGDEEFNPHEERCIGSAEACHAWLSGGVDPGEGELECQARSDGHAVLEVRLTTSDAYPLQVRDGAGAVVYSRSVQFGGVVELDGAPGQWTLAVDFDDVAGSGSVILWG